MSSLFIYSTLSGHAKSEEDSSSSRIDAKFASRHAVDASRSRAKSKHAFGWRRRGSGIVTLFFGGLSPA